MNSRTLLILTTFLLFNQFSFSQVVNENINFDNYVSPGDNDLQNHYYGMQSLTQIPTNGITGGCLLPIDSNNWGNDNSRYCSKYSVVNDSVYVTSICFKYNQSLINAGGFDRAVSIWLQPHTDPNHYLISTVSHAGKIEIISYSTFSASTLPLTLQTGHWYKLQVSFFSSNIPTPGNVLFNAKVDDIGLTGLSAPVLIDSVYDHMQDSVFATDNDMEVSITGARFGGTQYLDNFHFEGTKSADSCLFTGIGNFEITKREVKVYTSDLSLFIEGNGLSNKMVEIFDVTGKKVLITQLSSDRNEIDVRKFAGGVYFLRLNDIRDRPSFKFLISNNN